MAPTAGIPLILYQAAYVITGAATVLIIQWQDSIEVDSETGRTFAHPVGQVLIIYVAMVLLWVYRRSHLWLRVRRGDTLEVGADIPLETFRWWRAGIPGFLHLASMLLTALAIRYTTAAIVQILRGAVVIFSAALTRVLLKRKLKWYQLAGIAFVVGGASIVSVATVTAHQGDFGPNPLLGDILTLVAQFLLALRGVAEEHVMRTYQVHELEMAGCEGIVATALTLVVFAAGAAFPALALDDFVQFFQDIGSSNMALLSAVVLFVCQPPLQATSLGVVKVTSAVTKTVLSQLRVIFVWAPSVAFLGDKINALEIVGFAVLTFGVVVYENVLPRPPCLRKQLNHLGHLSRTSVIGIEDDRDVSRRATYEEVLDDACAVQMCDVTVTVTVSGAGSVDGSGTFHPAPTTSATTVTHLVIPQPIAVTTPAIGSVVDDDETDSPVNNHHDFCALP
eukprot:CAMPEP_0174833728 /NCGR_PEP_ID=MMETSP1114-20130205/4407_1 /TAXON_ID=312471 /ORGANISM="Neobodo designis, Strain CCAP 1951/1" /LENGTH=449 /DNA_ID=CAMNT_0016067619 /DNA_START=58 /DNA_END=1407 /DNA_ORIENTATION=+